MQVIGNSSVSVNSCDGLCVTDFVVTIMHASKTIYYSNGNFREFFCCRVDFIVLKREFLVLSCKYRATQLNSTSS